MSDSSPEHPSLALRHAITWAEHPGAPSTLGDIRPAVQAGASLDTPFEDGFTPLTFAIDSGMGSPKAVAILLDLGADPLRRDAHGWTPWGRCQDKREIPSMTRRMEKIQALLEKAGADRSDAWVFGMRKALVADDRASIRRLVEDGIDLDSRLLSSVQVAILQGNADLVRFLLSMGAHPDGPDPHSTALMAAVQNNQVEIVRILLDAGADPHALWQGLPDHSLIHLARLNGHKDLAKWLCRVFPAMPGAAALRTRVLNPKLRPVLKAGTNGVNHEIGNEDILQKLDRWDLLHGIELDSVEPARLTVRFNSLPDRLAPLAAEIAAFCPDVVEQGFGVLDDILAMFRGNGSPAPPEIQRLVEGIDLSRPDAGIQVLARSLRDTGAVTLWWD